MTPTEIALHQKTRILALSWPDGVVHQLPCELLRVYSPSAEVRGHGVGNAVLQLDKENVNITALDPVGHYAVKITFDDGHDSGLFDWNYLRDLGDRQEEHWADYLRRCEAAGHPRKTTEQSD
ncbi:DUF971 domain-containing protein [Leucothrix sargassi]|nr:DUF971 domain-containing protein [Leucothrix sargassi]